jgi:hypothetical protein
MNPEITEQHRSRPAYIYVRQSTNAQVLHHQESTEYITLEELRAIRNGCRSIAPTARRQC